MTHHQYGTLQYLINNDVTIETAGELSMVTFGSLIKRGWVKRVGPHLRITKAGMDVYESYLLAKANYRKVDTGLTDHVKHLLHLDKLLEMTKKKAS